MHLQRKQIVHSSSNHFNFFFLEKKSPFLAVAIGPGSKQGCWQDSSGNCGNLGVKFEELTEQLFKTQNHLIATKIGEQDRSWESFGKKFQDIRIIYIYVRKLDIIYLGLLVPLTYSLKDPKGRLQKMISKRLKLIKMMNFKSLR